jgi:hypothetical protein
LVVAIDTPTIKNEIIPMGSVFEKIEPTDGATIMESGKVKYGIQDLTRKD